MSGSWNSIVDLDHASEIKYAAHIAAKLITHAIPVGERLVELSFTVVNPSLSFTILDVIVVIVNRRSSVQTEVEPVGVNFVFIGC